MKELIGKLALVAIVGVVGLGPLSASAEHCADILVFTGYNDGSEIPENPTTTGHFNAGSVGCTNPNAHAETDYILPGATYVRVDAAGTEAQPASNVRVRFDGGAWIDVDLEHTGSRWRGQIIPIPEGTQEIEARGTTTNDEGETESNRVIVQALI